MNPKMSSWETVIRFIAVNLPDVIKISKLGLLYMYALEKRIQIPYFPSTEKKKKNCSP